MGQWRIRKEDGNGGLGQLSDTPRTEESHYRLGGIGPPFHHLTPIDSSNWGPVSGGRFSGTPGAGHGEASLGKIFHYLERPQSASRDN